MVGMIRSFARTFTVLALPLSGALAQAGRVPFDEGVRLMGAGRSAEAQKKFESAIKLEPNRAEHHLWLGRAIGSQAQQANPLKQGMMARRIKGSWERAVELDPNLIEAREGLITFYLMAPKVMGGGVPKAKAEAAEIAKRSPWRGQLANASIAGNAKDYAAQERALRAAVSLAPDSLAPASVLGSFLDRRGRPADALAVLDAYVGRMPRDPAGRYAIGRLSATSGIELARGERILRELIADQSWTAGGMMPSRAAAHYRLGMILERKGDTAGARGAFERSIALDPNFGLARDALAKLK